VVEASVPEPVRRFIAEHIESVAQLEALLLVRAAPDKPWSVDEVARGLVTRHDPASLLLTHLAAHGLVVQDGDGFRYNGARVVDDLAEAYATRRTTVVGLIFSRPDPAISGLADAFRFRGKKR
jgi:hypothetical protein